MLPSQMPIQVTSVCSALGVGHGLGAGAHVRLGDDLQQRRAGAVEVDAGHAVEIFVQRFAGIFFQVGAGEVDDRASRVTNLDLQRAALDDGLVQLADLVALGQVGIEVILALEHVTRLSVAPMARPNLIAHSTAPLFNTGSTPGSAMSTAHAWVLGSAPKAVLRRKKSWNGGELGMDFQPDDDFPLHFKPSGARACQSVARWYWCATFSIFASPK